MVAKSVNSDNLQNCVAMTCTSHDYSTSENISFNSKSSFYPCSGIQLLSCTSIKFNSLRCKESQAHDESSFDLPNINIWIHTSSTVFYNIYTSWLRSEKSIMN